MASLEQRNGRFRVIFRFGGEKFQRTLRTDDERDANATVTRLEENIRLVLAGRLTIPADADVPTFLLSDGKLDQPPEVRKDVTLSNLFGKFFDELPAGNLEQNTIDCMQIHRRHLERLLGGDVVVQRLALADLQKYVGERSKEPGRRGKTVGANTINKEIVTLRSVWNWAVDMGLIAGTFPRKGLRLPKSTELPPFQTWKEIERRIKRDKLDDEQQKELWECLYLTRAEIGQLLKHVKKAAIQPWVHPMFVMAAHTGARRSELIRAQVNDFDDREVVIHERKRKRGQATTRRVPMSSTLRRVMDEWFASHPGSPHAFCQHAVDHSKKRRAEPQPVTTHEATDHFRRTVDGSKWERIRGWHCLRHSFISNLASHGVDQRLIDEFVGHTTEAMRRRYRHLFPETKAAAIKEVFG